jgi:hypothetical protein
MSIKHLTWFSAVLVLGCLASGYFAYQYGRQHVVTARASSAIITLDALKKLRAGDLAQATSELESLCFCDSEEALSGSGWRSDAFRKIEVPSLMAYRATYRTNQADWSPMEQRLETLLTQKP